MCTIVTWAQNVVGWYGPYQSQGFSLLFLEVKLWPALVDFFFHSLRARIQLLLSSHNVYLDLIYVAKPLTR
jgi:hypothetical protein